MKEKMDYKSIKKTRNREIVDIDGHFYVRQIQPSVIIMPYTLDEDGDPKQIGIISEILDQRPNGISKTLISGSVDDNDANIFRTAARELLEESGFDVTDINRWAFLGSVYTSKMVLNSNPCFSVNVTSLVSEEKSTDGSQKEKDTKFELIDVNEALNLDDSLISTLFIKTFKNIFNKNEENDTTEQEGQKETSEELGTSEGE